MLIRRLNGGKKGVAELRSPRKLEPPFGNHHEQTLGRVVLKLGIARLAL